MTDKLLVSSIPTREWSYADILKWLFEIRRSWNINNVVATTPEQLRDKLKKTEVLAYIYEHFYTAEQIKLAELEALPRYDCYDIMYVGSDGVIKITHNGQYAIFAKGVLYTFYDVHDPLVQEILINYVDQFTISGRNYYSYESNLIDMKHKMHFKEKDKISSDRFFQVY